MTTTILGVAYCPGTEIVDGEPITCGSPARSVLASSREDHGIVTYCRCDTCGTRYVEITATVPGVTFGELTPDRRRIDRLREARARFRHRGPPQNDHPGRPRRPERRIRRILVELDDPTIPGQTDAEL